MMGMYLDADGNIHRGNSASYNSGFNGYLNDGTQITNGVDLPEDRKYYNLYTVKNNSNIGDALYETSGWNGVNASFVSSGYPFFFRGGLYADSSNAGVFYFNNLDGSSFSNNSFRVCLAV